MKEKTNTNPQKNMTTEVPQFYKDFQVPTPYDYQRPNQQPSQPQLAQMPQLQQQATQYYNNSYNNNVLSRQASAPDYYYPQQKLSYGSFEQQAPLQPHNSYPPFQETFQQARSNPYSPQTLLYSESYQQPQQQSRQPHQPHQPLSYQPSPASPSSSSAQYPLYYNTNRQSLFTTASQPQSISPIHDSHELNFNVSGSFVSNLQVNQLSSTQLQQQLPGQTVKRKSNAGRKPKQRVEYPEPTRTKDIKVTWWNEEKIPCYEVEVNGVGVLRRTDNNYVNATKLLNATLMTRGKRDGILKNELEKVIVRKGPMKFMGIWLPLKKAEFIAKREGIDELLFPLFERDVGNYLNKK